MIFLQQKRSQRMTAVFMLINT